MHYYWPTLEDMRPPRPPLTPLPPLPPGKQAGLIQGKDGTVIVTAIGRGWIIVPRDVWDAFAEAIKRGDYDAGVPAKS